MIGLMNTEHPVNIVNTVDNVNTNKYQQKIISNHSLMFYHCFRISKTFQKKKPLNNCFKKNCWSHAKFKDKELRRVFVLFLLLNLHILPFIFLEEIILFIFENFPIHIFEN